MKNLSLFIIVIIISACNNTKPDSSTPETKPQAEKQAQAKDNLDWLLGKWKRVNEEEGKTTLEIWKKDNANLYKGIGFTLQDGDTIKKENMQLIKYKNRWDLTVKVINEDPVTFSGTIFSDKTFTVVNKEIEFPNSIKYWMVDDTLKANVSNADFQILFDFVKMD